MRCFSITSSPTDQRFLQFSMRVKGHFTSAIKRLKVGDEVDVRGPFGGFVFEPDLHNDLVLFAGGIGVAPFISMLRYAGKLDLDNKIKLVYSCRNREDIAFFETLSKLGRKNHNLEIIYVLAEADSHIKGQKVLAGRVDDANINKLDLDYAGQTYMVCGPPPYMKAVFKLLKARGVPDERVLSEAFGQGSLRQTGKLRSWPINIYALGGVAMIAAGFFIIISDLYKTLPDLETVNVLTESSNTSVIPASNENLQTRVNSIAPQVDTNTRQPDKIITTPTPTTATTTITTTPPRSTVS